MPAIPPPPPSLPDPATLQRLFPEVRNPPDPGTFELGLVLGGTVSAGAYTGGALDFLIEALDAWHEANGGNPPHRVQLSVAGGSSGGAVCAAILSVLANRAFAHVTLPQDQLVKTAPEIDNQFWKVWVDAFDFAKLVDTGDLGGDPIDEGTGDARDNTQHVPGLLNRLMIDDASAHLVDYAKLPGTKDRSWVVKPFRLAVTVANLRGVPYKIGDIPVYGAYTGSAFVAHDDYAWFAVPNWIDSDGADKRAALQRPDEFWVAAAPIAGASVGYDALADWAMASSAMPVGFEARLLQRPALHYVFRPSVRAVTDPASGATKAQIDWPQPDWREIAEVLQGQDYKLSAVDGGTFNNDPVHLVHRALAGLIGKNPRSAVEANRAMLMIDPLVDEPTPLSPTGRSMMMVLKSLLGALVAGARYLTADMELFASENVFSRFQLVPSRKVAGQVQAGEAALAGTALYAFGGWCARDFRVHDFLLGRANMKTYLECEFLLAGDNPVFNGWSFDQRADFARDKDGNRVMISKTTAAADYLLPAIPVMPEVTAPMPDWPAGALDPSSIKDGVKARIEAVIKQLRDDNLPGFGPWLIGLLAVPGIADALASALVQSFTKELKDKKLWSDPADAGA